MEEGSVKRDEMSVLRERGDSSILGLSSLLRSE